MLSTASKLNQKTAQLPKSEPFWIRSQNDAATIAYSRLSTAIETLTNRAQSLGQSLDQLEYKQIQEEVATELKKIDSVIQHNNQIYQKAVEKYRDGLARIEQAKKYLIKTLHEEAKEKFEQLYKKNEKPESGQTSSLWSISTYIPTAISSMISIVYKPPGAKSTPQKDENTNQNLEIAAKSYGEFLQLYGRAVQFTYQNDGRLSSELKLRTEIENKSFDELRIIFDKDQHPVLSKNLGRLELDAENNAKLFKCLSEQPDQEELKLFENDFAFKKIDETKAHNLKKRVDVLSYQLGNVNSTSSSKIVETYKTAVLPKVEAVNCQPMVISQEALAKQLVSIIQVAIKNNLNYWKKQAPKSRFQINKIPVPNGIAKMHADFIPESKKSAWDQLKFYQKIAQERSEAWFSFWRAEKTTEFYKIINSIVNPHQKRLTQHIIEQVKNDFRRIGLNMTEALPATSETKLRFS